MPLAPVRGHRLPTSLPTLISGRGVRVFVILALSLVTLPVPLRVKAQQPAKPARLGYLSVHARSQLLEGSFVSGLREHGWIEGENLVINMRTAKALGLTFPQSILIRGDQVIQ